MNPRITAAVGLAAAALSLIAAPAAHASGGAFSCNGTYSGKNINLDLQVPAGGTCVLNSSAVNGNVIVGANGYFESNGTKVSGNIGGSGALTVYVHDQSNIQGAINLTQTPQVFLFDSRVAGNMSATNSVAPGYGHVQLCGVTSPTGSGSQANLTVSGVGPDVLIGDPASGCAGNSFTGDVNISGNNTYGEMVVRGNTLNNQGNLNVSNNTGTSEKFVQTNSSTGQGNLACSGNSAPFTASANNFSNKSGQCV